MKNSFRIQVVPYITLKGILVKIYCGYTRRFAFPGIAGETSSDNLQSPDGVPIRKIVGEPTKEVVYHVSSLDADSRTAEKFAEIVRTHWYVEVYHGKRDNGYHEDVLTRRCDESLMSAAMVARSFGMWICARRTEKTTEQVKRDLWEHPSKLVRIMLKGGLL